MECLRKASEEGDNPVEGRRLVTPGLVEFEAELPVVLVRMAAVLG
jgi:hypothetical protein